MSIEEQINQCKKQRTVLKRKFTTFINYVRNEQNHNKLTEFQLRLTNISGILSQFEDIQTKIDDLTDETSTEFEDFEKLYYENISYAHDIIARNNTPITMNRTVGESQLTQPSSSNVNTHQNYIKLPKIELTTFDGSFDKWIDFYNSFKQMIHGENRLSNVQKFQYLKTCLKGDASKIIESLEASDDNYTKTWEALYARFNNKRVIVQSHMKILMDLPNMPKESASTLRKFLDTIQTHLRALKTLGESVDTWGTLLIYIMTSKIDRETHREWEKSLKGTDMPDWKQFTDFLEERCQELHVVALNTQSDHNTNKSNHSNKKHALTTTQKSSSPACMICNGGHKLYGCAIFKNMTVKERQDKIKACKACFNCLNLGHRSDECKWTGCKKCGKKHNTLLHLDVKSQDTKLELTNSESGEIATSSNLKVHSAMVCTQVLLSTALINIKDKNNEMVRARVLLDSGSQSHFITKKFADLLKLPVKNINLPVEGLNQLETRIKHSVKAEIHSRHTDYHETVEFLVIPKICNQLPNDFIDKRYINVPQNITLADSRFYEPSEIDALLGAEIYHDLISIGKIEIPNQKARFNKTKLGWIISGKISNNNPTVKASNCMLNLNSLHKTIAKFWDIEEIENRTFLSEEQFQVEEHFKQTTRRDPVTGRYIVRIPFNEKIKNLGESFKHAERQFYSLERRLNRTPELKKQYIECMREAISFGHMVSIDSQHIRKPHCFLPHHPVVKNSSTTTKVRIVYNASAKTSTGISLNDCIKVGAVVQNTSFNIILRFRLHQIVILADIEKMYKQILLDERDIQYQLLLWRENENDPLKIFVIPVVLFGCASAPHSATRVLIQLADDESSKFPLASMILKRDCYVDDVITGADTVDDAKNLYHELIAITKAGGFTLRKWASNNPKVMESTIKNENINLFAADDSETKTLGIQWDRISDVIIYTIAVENDQKITKRTVLASIARIYDPIGLMGPVIVCAKILMQKLWQSNVGWDDTLPDNLQNAWINIKNQLPKLNEIKFNRKMIICNAKKVEIHGFCDASEKAYGACIYVRSIDNNGTIYTNLLCSKNRVAPLKTISLPKLELCAALLLSQLIKTVVNAFCKPVDEIFLWSDSSITLQWINTPPHLLKTFVANRVSEIRDITKTMNWRHVPSQENSADILSRGQLPEEFTKNEFWKIGPQWLRKNQTEWPKNTMSCVPLSELKPLSSLTAVTQTNPLLLKYSSINKLTRVLAYILRYRNNLNIKKPKLSGHLSTAELNAALNEIIKITQREGFANDLSSLMKTNQVNSNSSLKNLNPFLDSEGLIRVGGRLNKANIPYSQKHPIILPKTHHITTLIIREQHVLNLHGGVQATINAVRLKYWPLNCKNVTKTIIRNCVTCFRVKPYDSSYFMGNLPSDRVTQSRPFLNTGIDYCGPFFVKEKKHRNRGKIKVYACVFVCFTTKAVHIELVTDLSTETFIGSLRRFFARRGKALNLYTDNATNFVGAKNELNELTQLIKSESHNNQVVRFLTDRGINWHFIPPRSPHFGGLWEAAIKSFKHHYYRTVGEKLFTYEELETYTIEIEAILNSRPITPLSNDPNDLQALTPGHFLIGDTFTSLPDIDLTDQPINRLSNWQHIQYVKQHFWKRWYKEYLNQLITRSKWQFKSANDIQVGALVLLKEDNTPPLQWPLGRITEVFPGEDGKIRVITIKTQSGLYKRSVTRIAPLPIDNE